MSFAVMDRSSNLTHTQVLNSLAGTWQILTGTRLAFSASTVPFQFRRDDHYFVMTVGRPDGRVTVALQIADNNLVRLAAAMFGNLPCEIDSV